MELLIEILALNQFTTRTNMLIIVLNSHTNQAGQENVEWEIISTGTVNLSIPDQPIQRNLGKGRRFTLFNVHGTPRVCVYKSLSNRRPQGNSC